MEDEDIAPYTVDTAYPVGMGRKLRQYTIFQYSVQAQLSAHTDWISCMHLEQYSRLPFCVLIYLRGLSL